MKWNLRLTAANKGIWKASELQRSLAEHGLVISAGKMSGLWSGQPVSLKLEDLDVICVVLGCEIGDLLIPEPGKVSRLGRVLEANHLAAVGDRDRLPAGSGGTHLHAPQAGLVDAK
ncbi:helix-turn-helix transcriptional regulator [Streptomyces wedmorensis]|uniref:helix-turn-helix domain-containing protein n=1 Tax=Streptomyces wedmorensis TaxID=43759 RepID=UPI0034173671